MSRDQRPGPDELPALAASVVYEFNMWILALGMCGFRGHEPGVGNAWLEVLLLHTRTLADFFLAQPTKDDIVATDYVPGWEVTAEERIWLESHRQTLHKSLAHLTATRGREPHPAYRLNEIRRGLLELWSRFEVDVMKQSGAAAEAMASLLA